MHFPMLAALAGPALILAGCTMDERPEAAAEAEGRQCFWPRNVTGFSSAEGRDERLILTTIGNEKWLVEVAGPCPGLDFSVQLALVSRTGGMVCEAFDADLVVPDPTLGPQRCPVRVVRKLSEEEAEALAD